ncbi:hypothetical protein EDC96DRAFT_522130 [Choanephora cucurbitarum]|nr:hypothetical protein EDC96DRAFT_522130 [Choanephora cucurbitarum]
MFHLNDLAEALPRAGNDISPKSKVELYRELQQLKQDKSRLSQSSTQNEAEIQAINARMKDIKKNFQPPQLKAIDASLLKYDVTLVMPIGFSGDECVYVSAALQEGINIIICPFITTVHNHVNCADTAYGEALACQGICKSATLNRLAYQYMSVKMVCITPESFCQRRIQTRLMSLYVQNKIARFVIDGAKDTELKSPFRPSFHTLSNLKPLFPGVPVTINISLSAVAKKGNIMSRLNLSHAKVFEARSFKTSTHHQVVQGDEDDNYLRIKKLVSDRQDKQGILYCISKDRAVKMANQLSADLGQEIKIYHKDLENYERMSILNNFDKGKIKLLVATVSFTTKSSRLEYVLWCQLPFSMEDYLDTVNQVKPGGLSTIYMTSDDNNSFVIQQNTVDAEDEQKRLKQMNDYCLNRFNCRHCLILRFLGKPVVLNCCTDKCDSCLRKARPVPNQ